MTVYVGDFGPRKSIWEVLYPHLRKVKAALSRRTKLWLDDERPAPSDAWIVAKTADEAIKVLKRGRIIEVSLDHDLGPPEAGTGYDVICWIEEEVYSGNHMPESICIHTANPVARKRMRQALAKINQYRGTTLWGDCNG